MDTPALLNFRLRSWFHSSVSVFRRKNVLVYVNFRLASKRNRTAYEEIYRQALRNSVKSKAFALKLLTSLQG